MHRGFACVSRTAVCFQSRRSRMPGECKQMSAPNGKCRWELFATTQRAGDDGVKDDKHTHSRHQPQPRVTRQIKHNTNGTKLYSSPSAIAEILAQIQRYRYNCGCIGIHIAALSLAVADEKKNETINILFVMCEKTQRRRRRRQRRGWSRCHKRMQYIANPDGCI